MDLVTKTDSIQYRTVEHLYFLITSVYTSKHVSLSDRSSLDNSIQIKKSVRCEVKTTTGAVSKWACSRLIQ